MESLTTLYGTLTGISHLEYYKDQQTIRECQLDAPNQLITAYGTFIPQYANEPGRQKHGKSLSFYPSGSIKSIALANQARLKTRYGTFPAELITFHENESIKKLFPLNGQITGFWGEDNEYHLAERFQLKLPFITMNHKLISIGFYPSGQFKNVTLWPKDTLTLPTALGHIKTRIGFNAYPNGNLKSLEPSVPTPIDTPIGTIFAYDYTAIGIHSDSNSLVLDETGKLKSLTTSTDAIDIHHHSGHSIYFKPETVPSMMDPDHMDTIPLHISFYEKKIRINHNPDLEFTYADHSFHIKAFAHLYKNKCSDCSSCASTCV